MAIKTFTTGEVLTASDTNTYLANAGLDYITSATAANTSSILDIVGCFSATYDHYRIELSNFAITSGVSTDLHFRMLSGSTPTTTGTYGHAWVGLTSRGASTNTANFDTTQAYMGLSPANPTTEPYSASFDVFSPFLAKRTGFVGDAFGLTGGLNAFAFRSGGCYQESAVSFDGLRIFTSPSINITGKVRIYGYRQA
jgi:hypothetical protein